MKLWQEAGKGGDAVLADLIILGAFTGARIEELSSLKLADVVPQAIRITDSKTATGIREVPIHSALRPIIERRQTEAVDEYLLPSLTFPDHLRAVLGRGVAGHEIGRAGAREVPQRGRVTH